MSVNEMLDRLDEYQRTAATHLLGSAALVVAGAGSGKTALLTARVKWLLDQGIPDRTICTVTFTNKAANELRHRIGFGKDPQAGPRVSTIHSLSLSAIRKDPRGFGLSPRITPLDPGDSKDFLERLLTQHKKDPKFSELKPWNVLEKINYHRARGIGFTQDYTAEYHRKVQGVHAGLHVMTPEEMALWVEYEKAKTCHPAGTKVLVVVEPAHQQNRIKGMIPARLEERPIESLKDGDSVVTWRRKDGRVLYCGRPIRVAHRNYRGDMLTLGVSDGNMVKVTPDHYMWVRFNENIRGKFFVYLMFKEGLGFRVGVSTFKRGAGSGISMRLYAEGGDCLWVLKVCDSKFEATTWEQVISFKYGIPQTLWAPREERHQELIRLVFTEADPEGGRRCLAAHHLLEEEPLIRRGVGRCTSACMRFFKTAAANVLPGLMNVPAVTRPTWDGGRQQRWRIPTGVPVTHVVRERFEGQVFSLDVDSEHTYVAGGVIVANCASVVDFDDMLHLVVRRGQEDAVWRGKVQSQFNTVLVDEFQDTSVVQCAFVELLLHPDNPNLYVVGDVSQCQPPGTMVRVVVAPPRGATPAVVEERPIETLRDGDRVVVWNKHVQISYSAGRSIRVAQRPYDGSLVKVTTALGSTECTPNHWNWVRFNKNTVGKHMVYLMHRADLGFRVGISVFKRGTGGGQKSAYGLTYRFAQERADKAWILRVCSSRAEAEAWEEVYSVKYGIPESVFEPGPCLNKTLELIQLVFHHANPGGGFQCLQDHGLLWTHPFVDQSDRGTHGHCWRGFFKTAAANIIPGIMDIPIPGRNASTPITATSSRGYNGFVYSLDVEKEHTYIADGLVVGNSIYGWNGASPDILMGMVNDWRGAVPALYKLENNYRSLDKIVKLANRIQQTMTGTVPLTMHAKRPALQDGFEGKVTLLTGTTPRDVAQGIADTIVTDNRLKSSPFKFKDNAILVRAASQIPDIEAALVSCRIPYVVRDGISLLQTEEAKDLFSYMKLIANPNDVSAFARAIATPTRGVGPVAIEKVRKIAEEKFEGDILKACCFYEHMTIRPWGQAVTEMAGITDPAELFSRIIKFTDYKGILVSRYRKDQDRLETKLQNLERIKDALIGLVQDSPTATTEDIIFRITMDGKAEAQTPDGAVTISTIHSGKGLEWPRVYVVNVIEGSIPIRYARTDAEIEEERRLFYVAVTRARDYLAIGVPQVVMRGPNSARVQPSRFLGELGIHIRE